MLRWWTARNSATDSAQSAAHPRPATSNIPHAAGPCPGIPAAGRPGKSRSRKAALPGFESEYLAFAQLCRPSHDLPALLTLDDGFRERIQRDVLRQELFQNRSHDENSDTLESRLVEQNRNLKPARERDGPGRFHTPQNRLGMHAQHSFDLPGRLAVARMRVKLQHLAQP